MYSKLCINAATPYMDMFLHNTAENIHAVARRSTSKPQNFATVWTRCWASSEVFFLAVETQTPPLLGRGSWHWQTATRDGLSVLVCIMTTLPSPNLQLTLKTIYMYLSLPLFWVLTCDRQCSSTPQVPNENSHSYFLTLRHHELSLSSIHDSRKFVVRLLFKEMY